MDHGSGYDFVLVPNFLHHFKPETCVRFLIRVDAALARDGRVLIADYVPDEDGITPPMSARFAVNMLMTGWRHVRAGATSRRKECFHWTV